MGLRHWRLNYNFRGYCLNTSNHRHPRYVSHDFRVRVFAVKICTPREGLHSRLINQSIKLKLSRRRSLKDNGIKLHCHQWYEIIASSLAVMLKNLFTRWNIMVCIVDGLYKDTCEYIIFELGTISCWDTDRISENENILRSNKPL